MPMRKDWTWIGGFGPELMLCAASARVGPARTAWWAVWDGERLHERSYRRRGPVGVSPERSTCPACSTWRSSRARPGRCARARCGRASARRACAGRRSAVPVDLPGLIDESAGRHPRRMSWWWSAGAGELADGRAVTWNLVDGLHDGATDSERAVWIDGVPRARAAAAVPRTRRRRRPPLHAARHPRPQENLLLIASDYEQPFGDVRRRAPARRRAARRLGRDGAPPRALVTTAQGRLGAIRFASSSSRSRMIFALALLNFCPWWAPELPSTSCGVMIPARS